MNYKITERLSDEEIVSRLIYRDGLILVINKPAGLPVHAANGGKHNLEQYCHLLRFGLPKNPVLAHRLDMATSGCLVLARHTEAARRLQRLFTDGQVKKRYVAIVRGTVANEAGRIDVPLAKQSELKKHWWMKADPAGTLTALTDYRVIKRSADYTWLELEPHTGRTHQLRVHCAYLGHPIVGDYIYDPEPLPYKLCLHAARIELPLYPKKAALVIEAELPGHFEIPPLALLRDPL
jgi:tRNA pseudouridine32 synthase/23S rRNA pseudouridine746 synthase